MLEHHVLEHLVPPDALFLPHFEAALDEVLHVLRDRFLDRELQRHVLDVPQVAFTVPGWPRLLPEQQLVGQHPDAPDIALCSVGTLSKQLRCHVQRRSDALPHRLLPKNVGFRCKPEISHFVDIVLRQGVLRLDVAVDVLVINHFFESLHELFEHRHSLGFLEHPPARFNQLP